MIFGSQVLGCFPSEGSLNRGHHGLGFDRIFTPITGTPGPSPVTSNQDPPNDVSDMMVATPEKSRCVTPTSEANTARLTMTTILEFKNEAARVHVADVTISSV